MKSKVDEDFNIKTVLHEKYIELSKLFFGGIPDFTLWVILINYLL